MIRTEIYIYRKKYFQGDFFSLFLFYFLVKRNVCFLCSMVYCISQSTENDIIVFTLYMEEIWNEIYFRCFMPLSHLNVFLIYILVLFQFYSKMTLSSQSHLNQQCLTGVGEPFINFKISADFKEILYISDAIFV